MAVPECQSCAACCYAKHDFYVPVLGDDYERLGPNAEYFVVWSNNKAFMKMEEGHCKALVKQDGQYLCSIYKERPKVCRDLERGSLECKACIWGL